MYGYIYKVTNVDTGSFYIGQHRYDENEDFMDYLGTSSHPDFDLKNYDRKCFVKEKIDEAETSEELLELERKYIFENINVPGNVNNIKGVGFGGQHNYTDEEWAKKSSPENVEYLAYCPKCGKETYHYKNGSCKGCIAKITYEEHQLNKTCIKTYQEKYCPLCGRVTKHSGKNFENCSSCYNRLEYNLVKIGDKVALRSGTNVIIEDVSFILNTKKEGNTFVLPAGLTVTDRNGTTEVKKLIKNKDVSDWLEISFYGNRLPIKVTGDHPLITDFSDFVKARDLKPDQYLITANGRRVKIQDIKVLDRVEDSYDLETESGFFNFSTLRSRNCRTRVISNVYDPTREIVTGRGNLSFTSINLPRLGILADHDIDKFFKLLDEKIDLVIDQLLDRLKIQSRLKVKNLPFLMGQGIWLDSEKLKWDDTIGEVIKHGSLSIGFIGLAETLVALIGKHHGESDEAEELGLKIISHMNDRAKEAADKYHLNFGIIGTPAEGLSNRFTKIDKKKFGIITGVTDREYYTNSSHVPVYYNITAYEKIKKEAKFHQYEPAGHICYVELDGDPSQNIDAFMHVVRAMKEAGVGYGALNHPVDRDVVCGFSGVINDVCPGCGRREDDGGPKFERIRRITGYLVGTLDRFNDGKRAEEHDRVKHAI